MKAMKNSSSKPALTPMMRQYFHFKKAHPDKFIFFRLGDFYEMFYEDAIKASKLLQISLTKRHHTPMCGIPYHQLDNYTPKLIRAGHKIVIVDQTQDPKDAKGIMERGITQILTPATIIDANNLTANENNYLGSIIIPEYHTVNKTLIGHLIFAVLDFSTGEVNIHHLNSNNLRLDVDSFLSKYMPREILVSNEVDINFYKETFFNTSFSIVLNPLPKHIFEKEYAFHKLRQILKVHSLESMGLHEGDHLASAYYSLIYYASEMQKTSIDHIRRPRVIKKNDYMLLDHSTQKNLELLKSSRDGSCEHSLLWVLDQTVSSGGGRLLRKIILHPLLSQTAIEKRLKLVDFFVRSRGILMTVRSMLKSFCDLERLSSKVSSMRISPREMIALKNALKIATNIFSKLEETSFPYTCPKDREVMKKMVQEIENTLLEEPKNNLKEGHVIRPEWNPILKEYKTLLLEGTQRLMQLQADERQKTNIPSLRIKYNDNFGYFFEVTKSHVKNVPDYFIKKQTLVSAERYLTADLLQLQVKILDAEEKARSLESKIYLDLARDLTQHIHAIQRVAHHISYIDVLSCLAHVAIENQYTMPVVHESKHLSITDGRHPVVEKTESFHFIANSLSIGDSQSLIQIITGPNMAGKSTFLRQNALIILMAQMGSFVPAREATISLCDRIFTRIGASDNLAKGESTFLVEMNEAAYILNNASEKSFIIMDEIGRGTSTYDGIAIASAVIEYIVENQACLAKTLFATHYSELTLLDKIKNVSNYTMSVTEENDELIFHRKVLPGKTDKSYGVQVAKLAGMPKEVITRAKHLLKTLQQKTPHKTPSPITTSSSPPPHEAHLPIESLEMIQELIKVRLTDLTPAQAFVLLEDLQTKSKRFFA